MLTQPAQGHAYIYALDNPVNLTDPDGRTPIHWLVGTLGAIVGATVAAQRASNEGASAGGIAMAAAKGAFEGAMLGMGVSVGIRYGAAAIARGTATRAATRLWQGARAVARSAFRPGGWLNRGPHFRIGFGQHEGRTVFRAAGNVVKRLTGRPHIDFWKGGYR